MDVFNAHCDHHSRERLHTLNAVTSAFSIGLPAVQTLLSARGVHIVGLRKAIDDVSCLRFADLLRLVVFGVSISTLGTLADTRTACESPYRSQCSQ